MCASVASETSDGNDGASQRRERAALASFCESALRECARVRASIGRARSVRGRLRRRARRLRRRGRGARPRERAELFVRSSRRRSGIRTRDLPSPSRRRSRARSALADARLAADLEIKRVIRARWRRRTRTTENEGSCHRDARVASWSASLRGTGHAACARGIVPGDRARRAGRDAFRRAERRALRVLREWI